MCYEFLHPCDDPLFQELANIGSDKYFLVCIGHLNYLYSEVPSIINDIRALPFLEKVAFRLLSESEMMTVITFPGTMGFQTFHGRKHLYYAFISRNTKLTA